MPRPRRHPVLSLVAATATAACAADPRGGLTIVGEDPSDVPIAGLTDDELAHFEEGDALFEAVFREGNGLGPLYIRHGCASCHAADARGPGAVTKMAVVEADGITMAADQSTLPFGHTARTQLAAGATTPIAPPEGDPTVRVSRRFGPATFARGYLEAIDEAEILRVEAEQAAMRVVSGRVHRVAWQSGPNPDQPFHDLGPGSTGLIGRFGHKARLATVDELVADAYQGDMGITSPLRPDEHPNPDGLTDDALPGIDVDARTINLVADYVRLLAIPRRPGADPRGAALFESVGCASCHVPSLRTRADYPIARLAGIEAPLYTDVLLHDMGEALADGLREGDASEREWRTAPLVGLRHLTSYLHDGRARTVEEAIAAHRSSGSEASFAVDALEALTADEREALLSFVRSL